MNISLDVKSIRKIEFIDKLREKFTAEDNRKLKLPQIIVVGDQSSGKSSILEAISGIKLPKGVDMVTKCPIIIQMKRNKNQSTRIKHGSNVAKIITNTDEEIRKIQKLSFGDKLTKEPITIITESPNLHTLTMIDLPGIIKTVTTDQLTSSKEQTVEIAKFYMEQENSLIVCVLPANQDLCTTTTIELAKECNKDKSRIIVALTKLDKLDKKEATVIPDILSNKKLPIDKGYYGLIVSDDILGAPYDDRSKLEDDILKEFFFWKDFKERLGLKKFETVLVRELTYLIDKTLPILRFNINNLIGETQKELGSFSKYHENSESQFSYILDCRSKIDHRMEIILSKADEEIMKFPCMKKFLEDKNLLRPVKKNDTFLFFWQETFKTLFDEFNVIHQEFFKYKRSPYYNPQVLEEYINRSRTENSSLFMNPKIFKVIVDEILDKFKEKSSKCLSKCYQFIEYVIETVLVMDIETELNSMKMEIQKYGKEVLEKQNQEIIEQLNYLYESEKSYFSLADVIDVCGDVDNTKSVNLANPVSNLVTPNLYQNTFSSVGSNVARIVNPESNIMPINISDEKSGQEDNSKYKNGIRLKKYLEKHVTDIIFRFRIVIPNFIRLSLFVRFQEELKNLLTLKVFRPEIYPKYFNISQERKNHCSKLKETLEKLKESIVELNELESKQNGFVGSI